MESLRQDLRYALRQVLRNPNFTAVAVLTLALGIGANSAMFGVLDALFLRPPPGVHEPDELARIYIVRDEGSTRTPEGGPGSYPDYHDLRTAGRAFSSVAGQLSATEWSLGRGAAARQVTGLMVTGGYFPTLGTRPALGRFFGPAEDSVPGAAPVAVISHDFWQRRFDGNPEIIGRRILLEWHPFTVIGVAPVYFHGIDDETIDVWVPTAMSGTISGMSDLLTTRGFLGMRLFARLAPGVSRERGAADAAAVLRHASEQAERLDPTPEAILGPLNTALGSGRSKTATTALWLALVTGIVLLIACANLANMLLAKATRRRREVAVRLALGAGRLRLLRQLLTESILLALLSGAAGLVLALWSADLIRLFDLPPMPSVIDARMLAFTFTASVLTGVIFGTIPALQSSRVNLVPALKDGAPAEGPSRSRTRTALLVGQMALSLVLLIGTGLLIRSLIEAQSVDSGIDIGKLLYVTVDLDEAGYSDASQAAFRARAVQRLAAIPGVQRVSVAEHPPYGGAAQAVLFKVPGLATRPEFEGGGPYVNAVTPEHFQTVGVPVLQGREFTEADREGSPPVAIVNERMAQLYWPEGDALGGCIQIAGADSLPRPSCTEVVGVVGNVRRYYLDDTQEPTWYLPRAQAGWVGSSFSTPTLIVRTNGEPSAMIGEVRAAMHGLAPNLPFVNLVPVTELIGPYLRPFRLGATLFSLLAGLALVLAAVGLYGVMAFTVAQRTREIGIRIALGAERDDVLRLVVSRALLLTLVGVGIGLAGAIAVTRFMRSLLIGVDILDPLTFAIVPLLLITVALFAAYLPARRATRVDPMIALRAE